MSQDRGARTARRDGPAPSSSLFARGLIVSCQAPPEDPLDAPTIMAAFAEAAAAGGAVGIRANGVDNIRAIRARVSLPILGLYKDDLDGTPVRITPTREHARMIADAGANIIAVDATRRSRPAGENLGDLIALIGDELGLPVCADVSTLEEGRAAASLGAALVATTLAGHTDETRETKVPAFDLISALSASVSVPVLAEGGIVTPSDAVEAIARGAYAVVVGTAITRPEMVTRRFTSSLGSLLAGDDGRPS